MGHRNEVKIGRYTNVTSNAVEEETKKTTPSLVSRIFVIFSSLSPGSLLGRGAQGWFGKISFSEAVPGIL